MGIVVVGPRVASQRGLAPRKFEEGSLLKAVAFPHQWQDSQRRAADVLVDSAWQKAVYACVKTSKEEK